MDARQATECSVKKLPRRRQRRFRERRVLLSLFLGFAILVSQATAARLARAQTVEFRQIAYSPLGNATLNLLGTPETGVLSVENIGSSGTDGAVAGFADACFYSARWNALPVSGSGDLLRFRIHGLLGETPDQLLGIIGIEQSGSAVGLVADLIPGGVFPNQIRVHEGTALVYGGVIADTGEFATVTTWPNEMSLESACSDAISSSFAFSWDSPTTVAIAGGPTVSADRISIGSIAFGSTFSEIAMEAASISPIVISDAQVGHRISTGTHPPSSAGLALAAIVPNPFNPRTEIQFSLSRSGIVQLAVYDLRGHLVNTILHDERDAGEHSMVWNGTDADGVAVSSGIYLVTLTSGAEIRSRKIALVR